MDDNVQIKHNIKETTNNLQHMIQIMGIKKSLLSNMTLIADFSYAWVVIHDYLELLQKTISNKPKAVLMLKTVFLKLSTIMERPLLRIL
jgi:WASH complex subunit strumpellin